MMGLAMKWLTDAQPARLESVLTTETTGQKGKSTVWRGFFASPRRRSVKTIVCSGSRRPDAPPFGVSAEGSEGAYNADAANLAFLPLLVKTDTDKAFEITRQHGGDAILKKNAQQPITYLLLKDRKQNVPVWYVIYGTRREGQEGHQRDQRDHGCFHKRRQVRLLVAETAKDKIPRGARPWNPTLAHRTRKDGAPHFHKNLTPVGNFRHQERLHHDLVRLHTDGDDGQEGVFRRLQLLGLAFLNHG
jgi:hypothetical protein